MENENNLEIIEAADYYVISDSRKNKSKKGGFAIQKIIPKEVVRVMKEEILSKCDHGEVYGYRWIANKIMEYYGFDVNIEAWNGGTNRNKYYLILVFA